MRIEGKKIDHFTEMYDEWKRLQETKYALLDRHMEQYRGSRKIDGMNGVEAADATVVRNISYELVEAQVDTRIPAPIVTPKVPSASHIRYARNAEHYLRQQVDEQPFEESNDIDERRTYIYGGSGWMIEWDNTYKTHDEIGRPEATNINPVYIVGQPGVFRIRDMDAVFVRYNTTRDDVMDKYGVSLPEAEELESDDDTDTHDDTVTVIVCWYRDEGKINKYVFSDDTELEDIEDYWSRKREVCSVCGKARELTEEENGKCRCGGGFKLESDEYEELTHDIVTSDERIIPAVSVVVERGKVKTKRVTRPIVDEQGRPVADMGEDGLPAMRTQEVDEPVLRPTRIKWYKPTMIPVVIRRNTSQEELLLGQSDMEYIRPQQQEINKLESRIQRMLLRSKIAAAIPEDSDVLADDGVFDALIRLKPGENRGMYGTINTTPDISSLVTQSDRIYNHAQRILGVTDSFMGQKDATAQSGVAKQIQVQQSAGRLASKRQMKAAAYAEIYEIMFQLSVAYADEPRKIALQDEFGIQSKGTFNRYDYLEQDEDTGEWYYDLSYTFSADLSGGIDTQSEQRWAQIAQDYSAGLYGDPARPETRLRMWLDRAEAGYPGAHKNIEFERKLLQAQVSQSQEQAQAQPQAQIPQQAQQQIPQQIPQI